MAHWQTEIFRQNLENECAAYGRIQQVADAADLSRVFVSRIINGHTVPTLDTAARIAEAVGKPLSELLKKNRKNSAPAA